MKNSASAVVRYSISKRRDVGKHVLYLLIFDMRASNIDYR
jgi:hypothetical protein